MPIGPPRTRSRTTDPYRAHGTTLYRRPDQVARHRGARVYVAVVLCSGTDQPNYWRAALASRRLPARTCIMVYVMAQPLRIDDLIEIPAAELVMRTSRSGGPGGQHANVTASRVEVSFDIAGSTSLPAWARARLLERLGRRVTAVAEDERSQLRNREIARERLAGRLRAALHRPKLRRPTQPGRNASERRLQSKRRVGERKRQRRAPEQE